MPGPPPSRPALSPGPAPGRAIREVVSILRGATEHFIADRGTLLAAGISYFALMSLAPLLLLALSIFGLLLRDDELQRRTLDALVESLPVDAPLVEETLLGLASEGVVTGTIALAGTIWLGSALATALRTALNAAFRVTRPRRLAVGKLIDLTVGPLVGILLIASAALTTAWRFAQAEAISLGILREQPLVWDLGATVIGGSMSFVAFLLLYWLVPNSELRPRFLWHGALLAAIAFEATKLGFAFYVANVGHNDVIYGSLGGVITFLIWVYLSAGIMIFGAEVAAEVARSSEERGGRGLTGPDDRG